MRRPPSRTAADTPDSAAAVASRTAVSSVDGDGDRCLAVDPPPADGRSSASRLASARACGDRRVPPARACVGTSSLSTASHVEASKLYSRDQRIHT